MEFLARLGVAPGTRMLDVACGAGQIAIPAARAGARVTGIDIASNWIQQGRSRAKAKGVEVRFDLGDAELLPYEDGVFDLVVSMIGAMFAPRPERVAAELLRVCRPGGRIALASWTPEGHIGRMFTIIGDHVPPPPFMASPLEWGEEAIVRERLSEGIATLNITRRLYPMRFPFPPGEVVDFSASTTARPIVRSRRSMPPERAPCARTSSSSGRATIARSTTRPTLRLNTSRW